MNVGNEHSRSYWMLETPVIEASPLVEDEQCDVAIVGAGIAGLSTAYELARCGRSVVVIDRGEIGTGMTARTTAHLATELDDFYSELIRVRDEDEARIFHDSPGRRRQPRRGDLPRRANRLRLPPPRRLSHSDRERADQRLAGGI